MKQKNGLIKEDICYQWIDGGYRCTLLEQACYGSVEQRWVLVHSKKAAERKATEKSSATGITFKTKKL